MYMIRLLATAFFASLATLPANADATANKPACKELVALYLELAKRSGETVSETEATREVMAENPGNAECAAMLALFRNQG